MPHHYSSYELETDSMQEYDKDEIVHDEVKLSQKQSLQIKFKKN